MEDFTQKEKIIFSIIAIVAIFLGFLMLFDVITFGGYILFTLMIMPIVFMSFGD